jgi:hypothetical protein
VSIDHDPETWLSAPSPLEGDEVSQRVRLKLIDLAMQCTGETAADLVFAARWPKCLTEFL